MKIDTFMKNTRLPAPVARIALLLAACTLAAPAWSAADFSGGVNVGVERDNNALQLSRVEPSPVGTSRKDTATRIGANVAAKLGGNGPLKAALQASYSHLDYDRFDELGNSEYNFAANVDWKPSQVYDVSLQGSRERAALGLADVGGVDSIPQTSSRAQGTLRLRPVASWQLGLTPGWSEVETELPQAPDFRVREKSGTAALDFLGAGRLVPGLQFAEVHGKNIDIQDATSYHQRSISGTLNYQATGLSTFNFAAGHTRRTTRLVDPSVNPLVLARQGSESGFTGLLGYNRQLTAKTGINLQAFRNFGNYDVGANLTVDTGVAAGINWAATSKISAALTARYANSDIKDVQLGTVAINRTDKLQNYGIETTYKATRRLSLRGYLHREQRSSELVQDEFKRTAVGLQLLAGFD